MKFQRTAKLFNSKSVVTSFIHTLILSISIMPVVVSADRFDPPSLKQLAKGFDSRLTNNIFNVDFLLAHVINNARQIEREGLALAQNAESSFLIDTAVFTNTTNPTSAGTVSAGSVVIPPGTTANTIIVINQNEGDSFAIQR